MKLRYGESIEYKKNRAIKIARNKARRKEYKAFKNNRLSNKANIHNLSIPKIVKLFSNGIRWSRESEHFYAPEILNIVTNTDEVLDFIILVASFFDSRNEPFKLTIDFDRCVDIDICSLCILDYLIANADRFFKNKRWNCLIEGKYPENNDARNIFGHSGLPKVFGIKHHDSSIITLDPMLSEKDTNTEVHRIIEYYNNCLKSCGYELNKGGIIFFSSLVNEIVDNAILHCGFRTPMYISGGYYNEHSKKGQLSIVSFGNTFHDSLSSSSVDESIKNKIMNLLNTHKKLNYKNYNENHIWTICALQSGISSMKKDDDLDRGNGTVKFIEAFLTYGQTIEKDKKPMMSILSGNTLIKFDGKYVLKETGNGNKIIAFNENNDLQLEPDSEYVIKTHNFFPGVAINIEFYIDKDYLRKYEGE